MAFRATATATALALVWASAVGCSSRGHATQSAPAIALAEPATSPAPTAPAASAKITEAAFNEDSDGARVVLSANAPLLYTSYEPRPDLLVVDLRDAAVAEGFKAPRSAGTVVGSIRFEEVEELGKRMTRLSIAHKPEAKADVRSVGQGLAIAFSGPTASAEAPAASPEPMVASEPIAAPAASVASAAPAAPVSVSPAARGEVAHALEKVLVGETRDGQVSITLLGDGWFAPKDFVLANPPRVVLDLPGVRNEVHQRAIAVSGNVVSRVRVSQFQTSPEFITRVVLDLSAPMPHAIATDGERLAVIVGRDAAAAAASRARTEPAVAAGRPATSPARQTHVASIEPAPAAKTPEPTMVAANTSSHPTPDAAPAPAPAPARIEPKADLPVTTVAPPPAPVVHRAETVATAAPKPAPRAPSAASRTRGDALFEAAAAALDQEQAANPAAGSAYRSRTITEAQTQFTGEPISLDLK
ncbi:MAG: AMIN domain-containing protein, partial [Acidobacteriota bacterium]